MAFAFKIHTERMASCNHEANSDPHKLEQNNSEATCAYYCTRCHDITDFNAHGACQQCGQPIGR
jgi:hypothetical protein